MNILKTILNEYFKDDFEWIFLKIILKENLIEIFKMKFNLGQVFQKKNQSILN